jgi:hypothetical protein
MAPRGPGSSLLVTLFLDEIAEIPALLQVKLLRAIQLREIRRVGDIKDVKDVKTDVRLIAASNRDLEEAVQAGILREDLFYRLEDDLPPVPLQAPKAPHGAQGVRHRYVTLLVHPADADCPFAHMSRPTDRHP